MSMELIEGLMMQLVSSLANIIELCAAFIIVTASLRAITGFLFKALFQKMPKEKLTDPVRSATYTMLSGAMAVSS